MQQISWLTDEIAIINIVPVLSFGVIQSNFFIVRKTNRSTYPTHPIFLNINPSSKIILKFARFQVSTAVYLRSYEPTWYGENSANNYQPTQHKKHKNKDVNWFIILSSVWNFVSKQLQFLLLSKSSKILFTLEVTLWQPMLV